MYPHGNSGRQKVRSNTQEKSQGTDLHRFNADSIMMPHVVADLRQLPAPLGRPQLTSQWRVRWLLPQQQNEVTVTNEQSIMMTIHSYETHTHAALW